MLKLIKKFLEITSVNNFLVKCYSSKILPADPSHSESLPVFEYSSKSSRQTVLYGWGLAEHGGLGHYIQKKKLMKNRTDPRFRTFRRPLRLHFGEHHNVKDIATGFGFSAFSVRSNTKVKVFGSGLNTDSQIGHHEVRKEFPLGLLLAPAPIHLNFKYPTKTKVTGLSAGRAHLVVNTDKEGVYLLGNNAYGQCGRPVINNEKYEGSRLVHNISSFDGEQLQSVECGQDHTLFLTESGKVYSCGWGADGQTGLGHYNIESCPSRVLGDIEGEKIIKVSSKSDCALAINDKGDVFGWGNSEYYQIFDESSLAQQINRPILMKKCQGFGKIIDIATAGSYCLMLNESGHVYTWGYGILGCGPKLSHSWEPKLIPPILFGRNDFTPDSKVTSIYCGLNYSAAISNYGSIYAWGKNKDHCLGIQGSKDQYFPLKVYLNAKAIKLALGVDHTLALCHPY